MKRTPDLAVGDRKIARAHSAPEVDKAIFDVVRTCREEVNTGTVWPEHGRSLTCALPVMGTAVGLAAGAPGLDDEDCRREHPRAGAGALAKASSHRRATCGAMERAL